MFTIREAYENVRWDEGRLIRLAVLQAELLGTQLPRTLALRLPCVGVVSHGVKSLASSKSKSKMKSLAWDDPSPQQPKTPRF